MSLRLILLSLWAAFTTAFVPVSYVSTRPSATFQPLCARQQVLHDNPLVSSSIATSDALGNIAIGLGGVIAFFLLLALFFVNFVVPQAAKELEQQTKALDAKLWLEYEDKLEQGQSLKDRPDLMQELGDRLMGEFDKASSAIKKGEIPDELKQVIDVEVEED